MSLRFGIFDLPQILDFWRDPSSIFGDDGVLLEQGKTRLYATVNVLPMPPGNYGCRFFFAAITDSLFE